MAKMELTFWYKDKAPGEVIEVSDPENPRWRGFAKPLAGQPVAAREPAPKAPAAKMTAAKAGADKADKG